MSEEATSWPDNTGNFLFLTLFQPMLHFYIPWKHQKTKSLLIFSGGIEVKHWLKMG